MTLCRELVIVTDLMHAQVDYNNDGFVSSEYGDWSCPMGNDLTHFKRFHAVHRHHLGWLAKSGAVSVNPVGLVEITSSSMDNNVEGNVALITLTQPGFAYPYWISLRTSLGYYDSDLFGTGSDAQGSWQDVVYIHRARETAGTSTRLIAKLRPGEYFEDVKDGISVHVLEINTQTTMATLDFQMTCYTGPGGFPPITPVTATPNVITSCQVNSPVDVTISITNDDYGRLGDNTACEQHRFRVMYALDTLPPSHPEWTICSAILVDSVNLPTGEDVAWEVRDFWKS